MRADGQKWPSLFVGNIPDKAFFDLDLKKHFEDRGYKIKAATVASDAGKTKSLGYGYLTFYDDSELERCFISMNNTMIKDKYIIVNR